MSTKTKSELGALLMAVGAGLVMHYVHDETTRTALLTSLGAAMGWLGLRKPGT